MDNNLIKNRTEILFLYEIENANPNGDPLNENRPRFDAEDGTILVSDVRLKRTIRDYWFAYKGFNGQNNKDIFVREDFYNEGDKKYLVDVKRRAKNFNENDNTILQKCIDIRVFGGVIPLEKDSITFTGPVQFQMGRSLNKAEIVEIQGTGAFASAEKRTQHTFRTEYVVPYAVIGFNGIVNEKAAEYSKMTEDDKQLLLEGIWEGTKALISRSKFGQNPLFLLVIDYKEPFYIGNLRQRLRLDCIDKNEMQIRSVNDYYLDVTELVNVLKNNKEKIDKISLRIDERLKLKYDGEVITKDFIENIAKNG